MVNGEGFVIHLVRGSLQRGTDSGEMDGVRSFSKAAEKKEEGKEW